SVSVRAAVCSLIPAPQVKTAGDSADGLDVDCALRVHSHAGLDSLSCSRGQAQTLIEGVLRGSRPNVRCDRLTIRAVVLTGRVAGGGSLGPIIRIREMGVSGGGVDLAIIRKKAPVARG